ncbi:MAG: HDOD domain-containing protein [Terriglobales bacterium]|jgi:HD-like signal output (HDOD) protein
MNAQTHSKLQTQIQKLDSISTAPVILQPLLDMLRLPSEEIKIEKVVDLVSYDSAIAGQCLRLANSPLYGRRQIETIRSAVMALGLDRVRTLLLGLCMNRVIPPDKWVIEPNAFWRHSLGCALVTQRMAKRIEYHEPEKAYLAGLLHDIGFLVNSILYTDIFRECLRSAAEQHVPLHVIEEQMLGFTHCDSGRLQAEQWGLSKALVEVTHCHHDATLLSTSGPLACLVHLSDLLCRVRYLGYGYDEIMGFELGSDVAWENLVASYPALRNMDLVRFTLDIDGAMDQIVTTVDSVFGVTQVAAPAAT